MEMSQVWLDLADLGISIRLPSEGGQPRGADLGVDLMLEGPNWPLAPYQVKVTSDPLRPAALNRLAHRVLDFPHDREIGLLILAKEATDSVVLRAARLGISVLVVPEGLGHRTTGVLVHPETRLIRAVGPEEEPAKPSRPGRTGWATFAVAVSLLDAPAASQNELAERCGITQGRVSKILQSLAPFWTREQSGFVVDDPFGLSEWLAEEYPRRPKLETAWMTFEPLVPMAKRLAQDLGSESSVYAISGDVAADFIVPWANPTVLKVYADKALDMERFGMTPAPRDVANVVVEVPADPYVLSGRQLVDGLWLASSWRVWLDLKAERRIDAAQTLRQRLVRRTWA